LTPRLCGSDAGAADPEGTAGEDIRARVAVARIAMARFRAMAISGTRATTSFAATTSALNLSLACRCRQTILQIHGERVDLHVSGGHRRPLAGLREGRRGNRSS